MYTTNNKLINYIYQGYLIINKTTENEEKKNFVYLLFEIPDYIFSKIVRFNL